MGEWGEKGFRGGGWLETLIDDLLYQAIADQDLYFGKADSFSR